MHYNTDHEELIEKDIEIDQFKLLVKERDEEITMLKNLNSGFVDLITNLKDKCSELQQNNEDQALTIDKLTEALGFDIDSPYIQAEQHELEDLEDELETTKNTIRYWERQALRLENEKANLHQIVNELERAAEGQEEELEVCNERNEDLRRELKSVANQRNLLLAEKNGSLDNHLDAVKEKDKYIDKLKDRCRDLHFMYGEKIKALEERNDTLISERAEIVRSQITKLDELRNRIDELEELNHELISENLRLEDGLADMGYYRDTGRDA